MACRISSLAAKPFSLSQRALSSAKPRPQSRRGEIESHAHLERRQSLMAMDKTDRRGRGLIVGEHNLNFAIQHGWAT